MYVLYFHFNKQPPLPFFPGENSSPSLPLPLVANSHSHEPKLDLSFSLCWCSAAESRHRVSSCHEIVSLACFNLVPVAGSQSIQCIHEKKPPAFQCVILKTWNGAGNLGQLFLYAYMDMKQWVTLTSIPYPYVAFPIADTKQNILIIIIFIIFYSFRASQTDGHHSRSCESLQ